MINQNSIRILSLEDLLYFARGLPQSSITSRMCVHSRAASGTEVKLSVPGHLAFEMKSTDRLRRWLATLDPGRTGVETTASEARKGEE